MKKIFIASMFLMLSAVITSCSKQHKALNCSSVINDALGNYTSTTSLVDLDGTGNTNSIMVQVVNSNNCDGIVLKLSGALTASINAQFNASIPVQGNYFSLPAGQTFQYNGISFKISSSAGNSLFVKTNSLNLNIIAIDAATGSSHYLNVTLDAYK